jgi:hypothetical protein
MFYYDNIGPNIDLQDHLDLNQGKIALCINREFNGQEMVIYDRGYPALIEDLKELISVEQLNKLLILI